MPMALLSYSNALARPLVAAWRPHGYGFKLLACSSLEEGEWTASLRKRQPAGQKFRGDCGAALTEPGRGLVAVKFCDCRLDSVDLAAGSGGFTRADRHLSPMRRRRRAGRSIRVRCYGHNPNSRGTSHSAPGEGLENSA